MEDMTINMEAQDEEIVRNQLRSMKILFFGMLSGVVFLLVSVLVGRAKGVYDEIDGQTIRILMLMSTIITSVGVFVSVLVRVNIQRIVGKAENLSEAFGKFLRAMIVALVACETGAIMCVIVIALGGIEAIPFTMLCVAMIACWFHFPNKGRLVEAYKEGRRRYLEEQRLS
jgi:hypothetical protein